MYPEDSTEDWLCQSAVTGDIYRGATVTIAAVGGQDTDAPLFREHDLLFYSYCSFPATDRSRMDILPCDKDSLDAPELRHSYYCDWLTRDVRVNHPWLARTWPVQDRYLSPRLPVYNGETFYWECLKASAAEHKKMEPLDRRDSRRLEDLVDNILQPCRPIRKVLSQKLAHTRQRLYKLRHNLLDGQNSNNLGHNECRPKLSAYESICGIWRE